MKFPNYKRVNFYIEFYETRQIPEPCSGIIYRSAPNIIHFKNENKKNENWNPIYIVQLIPKYLTLELSPNFVSKEIQQSNKGYLINLQNISTIDDYLKQQFSKNNKNKIKTRLNRLNTCFDTRYVVFNNQISKEEYSYLMNCLKKMLARRFKQRNNQNQQLNNWDNLYERSFRLLKAKKASLFVIYDNTKPIQITLQYHMQNILISAIPAYDIDYDKFGLGNTAIYKTIEWCIKNNISAIEMGYGDLDYKKRWSNQIYNFKFQLLYNRNKVNELILVSFFYFLYSIKEILKKNNLYEKWLKYYSNLKRKKKNNHQKGKQFFELANMAKVNLTEDKTQIDINTQEYQFLRKPVYDFQYVNFETTNNIKVYKLSDNVKNSYIITNNKKVQKLTFTN